MGTVQPLRRKVAVVGTAPSYIEAPYSDPDWEVWGCNGFWSLAPRWDRWFEMHTPETESIAGTYGPEYVAFLGSCRKPVYMQDAVTWVPSSVRYPVEAMVKEFGNVWACTPAYMLALAIHEDFQEIGIYGIDLTAGDEYVVQREWLQRLVGIALGKGVTVTFPESGSSLEGLGYRYGYEPVPAVPGAVSELARKEQTLALKHREQATLGMNQAEGARRALEGIKRALAGGRLTTELVEAALIQATQQRDRAVAERLEWDGALKTAARMGRSIEHVARSGAA